LAEIEALLPLAPTDQAAGIAAIRAARSLLPSARHVAVFETAFHHTLPSYTYVYGLPYEFYERLHVRRYGFHGLSHAYVCLRAAQLLKRRYNELEIVSCHLDDESSICAVDHGRSVDTTMGFTPTEGLISGTRCGDIDAGAVTYLQRSEGLDPCQTEELLNTRSGLLGISGFSEDMQDVEQAAEKGDQRALLALKMYGYRVRKCIGAYAAAMGGLDAVIFTGKIGQNSPGVRGLALQGLGCLGVALDDARNRATINRHDVQRISADESRVAVLVVPADEARMGARETLRALNRADIATAIKTQDVGPISIEVSAHHVHLSQAHVEALFGAGHQLTWESDLSQPGQFACREKVTLIGPKGSVERVRILGPVRKESQVEIAMTEQYKLGIHPPIRESGDLENTPGITLASETGTITIHKGVICALRHIHMTPDDALRYGVKDKSTVRVRVSGDRELIFGDVLVRVNANFRLAMHIDTDEANAAHVQTGAVGTIDGIQSLD
jgi:acetate kinase